MASQSYNNIEHIIVDGGSTDNTLRVIETDGQHVAKVISEKDNGIYDAMNKGIALATGDFIGILNSDDFYEANDVIEKIVNRITECPDSDVYFGDVVYVKSNDLSRITRYYCSKNFRPWKLRYGWMPAHPGTFIRNTVYKEVGPYRLDFSIGADYELFVRLFLVNRVRFHYIDQVVVRMREGGVSTSGLRANFVVMKEIVKACRVNGVYTNFLLLLFKIPFKLVEKFRRPMRIPK